MLRVSSHGPILRIEMSRTLLGRPLYWVSAYLIDGLLIDTGCPGTARELLAWGRDQGIQQVVNTHHHEDHIGGNLLLQEELGFPVRAPAASLPLIRRGYRVPLYRRVVWGRPRPSAAEPLGEILKHRGYRFQVIPTPGHAPDHVCLFDPERGWLVSGDLYIHERIRYLRRDEDPWTHLASLRQVMALDPRILLCGHAGVVEDGKGAIARKIAYWEDLAAAARKLRDRGFSIRAITRRLLGREGFMTYISFGEFSKANLIRALLRGPRPSSKGS